MDNFKLPFILRLLDRVLPLFLGKEVDYQVVRRILILKLTLDQRKVSAISWTQVRQKQTNQTNQNIQVFNYIMYIILGLFVAGLQFIGNLFTAHVISYGMLIFILLSVYVSEYSDVLLDVKEKPFYKVLPIEEKDLALAKKIHISLYIIGVAGSVLLPSLVAAFFVKGGLYALLFLTMGGLVAIFCISLAGALYFLLLKLFSGEKLKDILNYFQVFMTIAIIFGYQIIPRIINYQALNKLDFRPNPALYFLPSAWYAAIFAIIYHGQTNWFFYSLGLVGLVLLVAFYLLNRRVITPQFEKELSKLEVESRENKSLPKWKRFFCQLFSKSQPEEAYMALVSIHLSRDRNLKLKLYPQLANVIILPLIMIIPIVMENVSGKGFSLIGVLGQVKAFPFYLALYFIAAMVPTIYYIICQTDNMDTVWIYYSLPIPDIVAYIRAGVKVVLGLYFTPFFLGLAILFLLIYQRLGLGLDIFLIYLFCLLYSAVGIYIFTWSLPFSLVEPVKNTGKKILLSFISLFVLAAWGAVHYFFFKTWLIKSLVILALLAANYLWWKHSMKGDYVLARQ